MAKQKLRKTSKSGEFNVFPGQSTDNPLPRYSLALLRRQSNTLYLIASSLGQYRILPLLRHANRGDTNCSQKAMPTRGSSWVLCISARLEPPHESQKRWHIHQQDPHSRTASGQRLEPISSAPYSADWV